MQPGDESSFVPGSLVRLHGLKAAIYNGRCGVIVADAPGLTPDGRCLVSLMPWPQDGGEGEDKRILMGVR